MQWSSYSTGERIKMLRGEGTPGGITQAELAQAAGISVHTLRKAERDLALTLETLMGLSNALHVDTSVLLGQQEPRRSMTHDDRSMLRTLSRSVHDAAAGLGLDEVGAAGRVERGLRAAWDRYWEGRIAEAGTMAALTVRETVALIADVPHDEVAAAHQRASDAYRLAAYIANLYNRADLAYAAIGHAATHARKAGNDLTVAVVASGRSWVSMRDAQLDRAAELATESYQAIEPSYRENDPRKLAIYGNHVTFSAVVAARRGKLAEADDLLSQSKAVAGRLGREVTVDGITFGPATSEAQAVGIYAVTGRPARALNSYASITDRAVLPKAAGNRLYLDLALAQVEAGRYDDSLDTLLEVSTADPVWTRQQALAGVIARRAGQHNPTANRYRQLTGVLDAPTRW